MAEKWIRVTAQEAQAHRLYGVKGWLLIFEVINTVTAIVHCVMLVMSVIGGAPGFLLLVFFFGFASSAYIVFLCNTKAPTFRTVAFWLTVGMPLVFSFILVASLEGDPRAKIFGIVGSALGGFLWGAYLQLSRRVRVTFEHAINGTTGATDSFTPVPIPTGVSALDRVYRAPICAGESSQGKATFDESLWAQALQEFDGPLRRPGLWAQVYAEANGDATHAKAAYLKFRVRELDRVEQATNQKLPSQLKETLIYSGQPRWSIAAFATKLGA